MDYNIIQGDVREVIQTLPDKSINTCITSPPYWGLRDYGNKNQIGLEKTPEEYIEKIVNVFKEVKRVLKDDGTVWLNLGDTYSGGGRGGDPKHSKGDNSAEATMKSYKGIQSKNLIGIPWRVALSLQYDGWILRQDIIWNKPNAMPEPVKDRCTKSHEYIFLLTKKQKYYYNHDAIKEPYTKPLDRWGGKKLKANGISTWDEGTEQNTYRERNLRPDPKGRNKRSVWTVNTTPYPDAHFAVFPEELITPCVLAGCPEEGTVLDPFSGSGTTGVVALKHNRSYIGIELNPKYVEMSKKRIESCDEYIRQKNKQKLGMFFERNEQ